MDLRPTDLQIKTIKSLKLIGNKLQITLNTGSSFDVDVDTFPKLKNCTAKDDQGIRHYFKWLGSVLEATGFYFTYWKVIEQ